MAYVTIQDWMVADLELSGNELIAYALIYGFSQDGESRFKGSRSYVAKWCGCSIRTAQNLLNSLVEKGLVLKYTSADNQICEYACKIEKNEPVKKLHTPGEKISLNKIVDNIGNNNTSFRSIPDEPDDYNSHGYSKDELKQEFLQSVKRKGNHKNLYGKCVDEIYNFTDSKNLQDLLISYLQLRLSVKDKPIVGVNQWKGLLNKLEKLVGDKQKIVGQSIEHGWLSFYEISKGGNRGFVEAGNLNCEQDTRTDEERIAEARKLGIREKF